MNELEIPAHFAELIEEKRWKTLKEELVNFGPIQIAEFIENLPKNSGIIVFRLLSRMPAKETFQYLTYETQEDIIDGLASNAKKLTDLLNDLFYAISDLIALADLKTSGSQHSQSI